MKKALVIFGTRPELIKLAPLVWAFSASKKWQAITCATAQHRELLDQGLTFFGIKADHDLNLMRANQNLYDLSARCLTAMQELLEKTRPDIVMVQGDTTTAFIAGLAAFYAKIPVAHVEAGLRTSDKYSPFPEEINRRLLTTLADLHFAPTSTAQGNLLRENIPASQVFCVGNTGIDALLWAAERRSNPVAERWPGKKLVLMTSHRRENFGEPLKEIFRAVRYFAEQNPDFHIIYPVHPNPNVKDLASELLGGISNISLVAPLDYGELVNTMQASHFILTDSGGLQEEAPSFGKPILVLRENTERPEGVEAGCAKLVGHDYETILNHMNALREVTAPMYVAMSRVKNPFGDGTAARQIVSIVDATL